MRDDETGANGHVVEGTGRGQKGKGMRRRRRTRGGKDGGVEGLRYQSMENRC